MDKNAPTTDAQTGDSRHALGPELGRGGGGSVYLGTDRALRRSVAVKVLPGDRLREVPAVQAFLEEAIITGGLEHPNIVPAYELGYSASIGLYYTMKRFTGRTLFHVMESLKAGNQRMTAYFTLSRLLGSFVDVCRAVAYAHSRGVVHTDLKPGNILIGSYGETVVVDWGLAQVMGPAGAKQVRAGIRAGTPEYVSPEQVSGPTRQLDHRSDVWTLGVILYEIMSLELPFLGKDTKDTLLKVTRSPPVPPSERQPQRLIPRQLEEICLRALQKRVDDRFQSVSEMLEAVEGYLEGSRERRRRTEHAERALTQCRAELSSVAALESEADAVLAAARVEVVDDFRRERLVVLREALLTAYEKASAALERGYAAGAMMGQIGESAGDVYWRVFTRVYPSTLSASDPVVERGMRLLSSLVSRWLRSIVEIGRNLAFTLDVLVDESTRAVASDDPWLTTMIAFCTRSDAVDAQAAPSAMTALVQRIEVLKRTPLFASMPAADVLPIAEACEMLSFPAGGTIARQGELDASVFIIVEGEAEVLRDDAVINRLAPIDLFGEIAALSGTERTATVRAVGPARCLRLSAESFRDLLRAHGQIGLSVVEFLSDRLRAATEREAHLRARLIP